MKLIVGPLLLLVVSTACLPGQAAPLDSARVTVSPACTAGSCWPFSVVLSRRGALEFTQARSRYGATLDPAETRQLFLEADSATITPLPERIDRDAILCPTMIPTRPVITVALYRGTTEWREVDFRWCDPIGRGSDSAGRANIAGLARLRAFEDAIQALPLVVTHNKP